MSEFCPIIWPEEPTPKQQQDCHECGLYKHGSRMVWGEGNPEAPIMVILDNPGAREDREGNPFVCSTRQTLQRVANDVNLKMDDLYITYILKRKPSLILCLGNVAVQSFFKSPEVDVKSLRGSWHDVHGHQTAVAYHPLAVRRRPNLWSYFLSDWALVADRYHDLKRG